MTAKTDKQRKDEISVGLTALAVMCWVLPLLGLLFGPGAWWAYLIWLALGTVVMTVVGFHINIDKEDR